jgi:chromosome segregation ATPase
MGLPLKAEDLPPRRLPSLGLVSSPPLDADAAALERLNREFEEPLKALESHQEALAHSYSVLRNLASVIAETPEGRESIEESLDSLRSQEDELASRWREVKESRERELVRARELASHEAEWGEYARLLDRFIELTLRLLTTMRDCRLEIATILAESDAEIDSPVFDDPDELKKYLESV